MITTVTLNPCNDKTVVIPRFTYGGMNRIISQRFDLSGKGFNVARGVARLGEDVVATGFLFEDNGTATQLSLEGENVQVDCAWLPGSIRTNLKIFDRTESTITEINEPGPQVSQDDMEEIYRKVEEWARQSECLLISGSLPPGAPIDAYAKMIGRCRPHCKVLLDAEGKSLLKGIGEKPFMIKPNRYELEMAVNVALPTIAFVKDAALSIIRAGVKIVAVSLGGDGAFITDGTAHYYAPPMENIEVRGTVGAGDSMMAGFCVGLQRGLSLKEMFRMGVAAATSCVVREGSALVELRSMESYLPKVKIEEL